MAAMIQFGKQAVIAWVGCVLLASLAEAAKSETGPKPRFEAFHVILMFDQGPIHARFGIALNGRPVAEQRKEFLDELIKSLDTNGDNKLTQDEANKSYLLRQKVSKGTSNFIRKMNLASKMTVSTSDLDVRVKKVAGQPVVFRQNDDAFESDEFIFDLIDADQSGVIDQGEMESAAERLVQRDVDEDDCIGFDEVQPDPVDPQNPQLVALGIEQQREDISHSIVSDLMRRTNERNLPLRMLRKYDLNGNGRLSPKELSWHEKRIKAIDVNGDGELSRSELRQVENSPLDIDLTVDVAPADSQAPELEIRHSTGRRVGKSRRPGIVNLLMHNATLTLSYRHIDPITEAIDNARRKFNTLDTDTNGYLDEPEIEGETLLQRGLFDEMDTDDDKKVFSEELDDYVRQRAEARSMSCQVSIYDTGNGYFQTMDHNNDGRISVRERRVAAASLNALASDSTPGVTREEPARRYHIEFARGRYLLFGPTAQRERQTISFNTGVSVGPAWFTGSDRNNDGDLTWQEFLGHREDFHYLDADGDGLIDPIEAQRAVDLKGN